MNTVNEVPAAPSAPSAAPPGEAPLALRASPELSAVPLARSPAAPIVTPPAAAPSAAPAAPSPVPAAPAGDPRLPRFVRETPPSTWAVSSLALLATVAWVSERRKRVTMEEEKDSVMWARVQHKPQPRRHRAASQLDSVLPDGPDPNDAARAIYAGSIAGTTSRREATLTDLRHVADRLQRRREYGESALAAQMLQQHLVDFRYSSPWVFLELRELYRDTQRANEWNAAREAFRARFGQNAPQWAAPSTANQGLDSDPQIAAELARQWPRREARFAIVRWMLGDDDSRRRNAGPPLLPLGVYRDLLMLDGLLDELMPARGAAA